MSHPYQIRRNPPPPQAGAEPLSVFRCLYGKKTLPSGQVLLLTADIHLRVPTAGGENTVFPTSSATYGSQQVADSSNGLVGTVRRYDWPAGDQQNVNPVVEIIADDLFNTDVVPNGAADPPPVSVGDTVFMQFLMDDGTLVMNTDAVGTITGGVGPRTFALNDHRAAAYEVDFGNLNGENHGARIVNSNGQLIGMLFSDLITGYCNRIRPANRI